jgi:hypothetical protein
MGEVYRARDTRLGRDVAAKVLPPEFASSPDRLRRFEQEARAVAALDHPNILAIHDVGTHEGSPYLVEELLEGESLRERLRSGALAPRKAVELAVQACAGLAAAHDKGVVHRDLKPENLFVTKDGRVKILDFGLAKLVSPQEGEGLATAATAAESETGMVVGTAAYMSPEQVRGQAVDPRSDIFSVGAVLYEMVTGRRAFARGTAADTMSAILKEDPPEPGSVGVDVPPALQRVVLHCLEKNPVERFQSARDLGFALESASGMASAAVPPVGAAGAPAGRRRLGFAGAALVLVAVAAVAAGIAFVVGGRLADRAHAARVTYQRLTARRGQVHNARFAPDGHSVFYGAAWDAGQTEIFEVRPGFPTSRAMGLTDTKLLAVSSRGVMAVELPLAGSSTGTLAEVPISGGTPRSAVDRVWSADWSPDGTTLAIAHLAGGKIRLEMPPGKVLYEPAGNNLTSVRVSPSGAYVAFVEWPVYPDTRGSAVIMDRAGRVRARTREWTAIWSVAWSADGGEAWFAVSPGAASCELRAMTPEGRERVVQRFPIEMWVADIARGGQVLLGLTHSQIGIRGRPSPEDEERELGWLDYSAPFDLSRDGRTLLFDEQGIGAGETVSLPAGTIDRYYHAGFLPTGSTSSSRGRRPVAPSERSSRTSTAACPVPSPPKGSTEPASLRMAGSSPRVRSAGGRSASTRSMAASRCGRGPCSRASGCSSGRRRPGPVRRADGHEPERGPARPRNLEESSLADVRPGRPGRRHDLGPGPHARRTELRLRLRPPPRRPLPRRRAEVGRNPPKQMSDGRESRQVHAGAGGEPPKRCQALLWNERRLS